MLAFRSGIKSESQLRDHLYMDMCHIYDYVGGFIAGITSLDADEEINVKMKISKIIMKI